MFLLDTDCFGIFQHETLPEAHALAERMRKFEPRDFYVSIVSFQEETAGWNSYLNRARTAAGVVRAYDKLQNLLGDFAQMQIAPFDDAAAQRFADLRGQRVRIGTLDLRIAAIALTRDLTLISRNLVDFRRVPGLRVEDWTMA